MSNKVTLDFVISLTLDTSEYRIPADGNYQYDLMDMIDESLSDIIGVQVDRVSYYLGASYDE